MCNKSLFRFAKISWFPFKVHQANYNISLFFAENKKNCCDLVEHVFSNIYIIDQGLTEHIDNILNDMWISCKQNHLLDKVMFNPLSVYLPRPVQCHSELSCKLECHGALCSHTTVTCQILPLPEVLYMYYITHCSAPPSVYQPVEKGH